MMTTIRNIGMFSGDVLFIDGQEVTFSHYESGGYAVFTFSGGYLHTHVDKVFWFEGWISRTKLNSTIESILNTAGEVEDRAGVRLVIGHMLTHLPEGDSE